MFTFLHELTASWTGSTTTRLVDACSAHLSQKQKQLEIASSIEENALRAYGEAQQEVGKRKEELQNAQGQLATHVKTHASRLTILAQAIMTVSNSPEADNIQTTEQVLSMASACCPVTFREGTDTINRIISLTTTGLEKATKRQENAKTELRTAKDRRTFLETQIREIESIKSQLQPSEQEQPSEQ